MKTKYLLVIAVLILAACTKEDNPLSITQNTSGEVSFEVSTAPVVSIKQAIYSQETSSSVTRVNIYAFTTTDGVVYTYAKTFTMAGWSEGVTFQRFVVPDTSKLAQGTYTFLAVGRNLTDNFTVTVPSSTTTLADMQASVSASGNESDIYAGIAQAVISSDGSRISIEMKKKVAGIMGYFKNVPQELNGQTVKYLRMTLSNVNQAVTLSTGVGVPTAASTYNVIDMDLSSQSVTGGVYVGNNLVSQGVVKLPNSQLSGSFIIPVSGISITLGLYDATGTAIKTWTVVNGVTTSFSLAANTLYSLGQKMQAGSTDNGTGTPGDDDNPIDLLVDQEIAITINPNWDLITSLTLQ